MKTFNAIYGKDFVERLLPQKVPFVMMDRMFHFSETSLTSGLEVAIDNIFFYKGFLAEAGLIEHMAQSAALHTGYKFYLKQLPPPMGYLGSIKDISILQLPKLREEIRTTITILQEFSGITLVDISSSINDVEIAKGQIKTVIAG
jgi:predicted hotdog family 3-hydroxylacyl-ACP dehydratase